MGLNIGLVALIGHARRPSFLLLGLRKHTENLAQLVRLLKAYESPENRRHVNSLSTHILRRSHVVDFHGNAPR